LKYEKQLRNLQLQENRPRRRYEKESAELRALQKERKQKEETEATRPEPAGFEFSTAANCFTELPIRPAFVRQNTRSSADAPVSGQQSACALESSVGRV
jgi:hypothetical protein